MATVDTTGPATSAGTRARSRLWTPVLTIAVSLALLFVIWRPFLSRPTFNTPATMDWRFRANYMSYTVKSIFADHRIPFWATSVQYHQLWSPDSHGFFSNPETEVISPYVILYGALPFGDAVRVSLLLHLLVGVAGLYALLALFDVRPWPVLVLCAVLLFGSGFFVRHVLVGHLQFVSYTYFPAALWLYLRAIRSPRLDRAASASLAASGLLVAVAYYEGNIHLVIQFLFVVSALSVLAAILWPDARLRALVGGAAVVGSFLMLAAFKLLPGIVEYGGYRPNDMNSYLSVGQFLENVLSCVPSPPWPVPHEAGLYLGIPGAIVVAIGLLHARRPTLPLLVLAFVVLLALFAPFGQWLVYVPVLRTQRPTRLRGELVLLAVVLSGDALARIGDRLLRWSPGAGRPLFAALLLVVVALVVRDQADAMRVLVNATRQEVLKRHNARIVGLHDAEIVPPVAVISEGAGTLTTSSIGPNRFAIAYAGTASPARSAVILLPDITSREASVALSIAGGERADTGGHVAVRVAAPRATIRIAYASSWMRAGLCLTTVGLVLFACLIITSSMRGGRRTSRASR